MILSTIKRSTAAEPHHEPIPLMPKNKRRRSKEETESGIEDSGEETTTGTQKTRSRPTKKKQTKKDRKMHGDTTKTKERTMSPERKVKKEKSYTGVFICVAVLLLLAVSGFIIFWLVLRPIFFEYSTTEFMTATVEPIPKSYLMQRCLNKFHR